MFNRLLGRLFNRSMTNEEGNLPPCDKQVYRRGEHIATIYDLHVDEIEKIVKYAARTSGQRIDWHYFGGRAVVKALGDLDLARAYLRVGLQPYEGKFRFTTENDSVLPWPLS